MKALIVANWKMNPRTFAEAKKLVEATKKALSRARGVSMVIAPPSLYLRELSKMRSSRLFFGVQHAHYLENGSFTGDIALVQAKDAKAQYVIIGHAERRLLGETNDDVRKKVSAAISLQLTPILCIGESQREPSGEHLQFIRDQLLSALADVPAHRLSKIVIAYEPVWAIGAAKAMQPRDMHEMSIFIRKTLIERFGDAMHAVLILYGGSIDAENAAEMMREGDVKGLLVGRASTDGKMFGDLITAVDKA